LSRVTPSLHAARARLMAVAEGAISSGSGRTAEGPRAQATRFAAGDAAAETGGIGLPSEVVLDGAALGDAPGLGLDGANGLAPAGLDGQPVNFVETGEYSEAEGESETETAPAPPSPEKLAFLQVLQRAKEGDLKAFEEIYQLYHRRIYNAVYGMLGDPDDAQDVTQDVFMRLYDALPTLRADEAFSTYLYRIALNLCRDRARRKKRVRFQSMDTPRTDDEGDVEPMEFPDQGKLPEDTLTGDELQQRVREAVLTLSPDHKAVIVMHHFQGMEVNDIASILGVPTGTVKSRLARGRDQLHRKLRSYLGV